MKKVILASVTLAAALASLNADAATATVCGGGSGGNGAAQTAATDGTTFVKVAFTPKCSTNVHLIGDDSQTYYRVGSTSTKGKNAFGGSTAGGAITPTACSAATGCTSSDATTALSAASST